MGKGLGPIIRLKSGFFPIFKVFKAGKGVEIEETKGNLAQQRVRLEF